jgi:uncharacterized protein (TIGR00730 family)
MEAGHEGAGGELSFGANIRLPFEAKPNPVIADDSKLINFKYFFTRKLTFMKEADAFVLLPGGFGTMDEAFELLTLVQTGKSEIKPIVMLDSAGGTYWREWDDHIRKLLLARNYISEDDLSLYRLHDDVASAVDEIERFFCVYHSQRIVGNRVVVRLTATPDDATLQLLSEEFSDILSAPIVRTQATSSERRDDDVPAATPHRQVERAGHALGPGARSQGSTRGSLTPAPFPPGPRGARMRQAIGRRLEWESKPHEAPGSGGDCWRP